MVTYLVSWTYVESIAVSIAVAMVVAVPPSVRMIPLISSWWWCTWHTCGIPGCYLARFRDNTPSRPPPWLTMETKSCVPRWWGQYRGPCGPPPCPPHGHPRRSWPAVTLHHLAVVALADLRKSVTKLAESDLVLCRRAQRIP